MLIGQRKILLDEVDSTNAYCARQLRSDAPPEGTLFAAKQQTSGRGQTGKSWWSEAGKNLTFSIALYPGFLTPMQSFALNQWAALGLLHYLQTLSGFPDGTLAIKWPNDLLVGGRKIAGILIETAMQQGRIAHAIAGIGLNVNQDRFPDDLPGATSVRLQTGRPYELDAFLEGVCVSLDEVYEKLRMQGVGALQADYEAYMFGRGAWRPYVIRGVRKEGLIRGVDEAGRLLMSFRDGNLHAFGFQEISFGDGPPFAL